MDKELDKRVLLVIPAHNRHQELTALLGSLNRLDCRDIDLQISIVDDASSPALGPELKEDFAKFKINLFRNETARGPGFCRNIAARNFEAEYLWFLDSDTEILDPAVLVNMLKHLESDPNMAGTGGALEEAGGKRRIKQLEICANFFFPCRSFVPEQYQPSRVKGIGSNNLLLRCSVFEQVGGFSQTLARDEDNDLCLNAGRLGYYFYQDRDTAVLHKLSSSGRQSGAFKHFSDSELYLNDLFKTRMQLLLKHKPGTVLILPALDALLMPLLFYRLAKGTYTGRFEKAGSAHLSSRLSGLFQLLLQSLKYYLQGIFLLIRSSLSRLRNKR